MALFKLKRHNNSLSHYYIENGKKVYYEGEYGNINILDAITNGTYNREFQNIISIEEDKEIPLLSDKKEWDEYSDKQLLEIKEKLTRIEEEMLESGINLEDKIQLLAHLYKRFQLEVKYYDIVSRLKFPISDELYLVHKNDNLYASLILQYASSKGICEMMKLVANYFDIACDVVKTNIPSEHYINKVYLENNKISYISLADEIGLIDGYYYFEKINNKSNKARRRMRLRKNPRVKKEVTYFFFLADNKELRETHKNIKGLEKAVKLSNKKKAQLFNNKNKKEKTKNMKSILAIILSLTLILGKNIVDLFQNNKKDVEKIKLEPKKEPRTKVIKNDKKEIKKDKKPREPLKNSIAKKLQYYKNLLEQRRIAKKQIKDNITRINKEKRLIKRNNRHLYIEKEKQKYKKLINKTKVSILSTMIIIKKIITKIPSKVRKQLSNKMPKKVKKGNKIVISTKEEKKIVPPKKLTGLDVLNIKVEKEKEVKNKSEPKKHVHLTEKTIMILSKSISIVRNTIGKMKRNNDDIILEESLVLEDYTLSTTGKVKSLRRK